MDAKGLDWNDYNHADGIRSFDIRIYYLAMDAKTLPPSANTRTLEMSRLAPPGPGSDQDILSLDGDDGDMEEDPDDPDCASDDYDDYDDDDDDDNDDDDDEAFIYLYPSPERRRLDPESQLARYVGVIAEAAITSFLRMDVESRETDDGYRFACPFYVHSPNRHRTCLRDDLKRIIDIKRHLWAHHRRPYDCPVCGATFDAPAAWDSHIRREECTPAETRKQNSASAGSISEDQLQLLARRPSPGQSDEMRWEAIWRIVLPGEALPRPAAREDALLRHSVALRRFWHEESDEIITQVLETTGEDQNIKRRDRRALRDAALDVMIDKLVLGI